MKAFWSSKTFWFNTLALIVLIAGNFGYREFTPAAWVNDIGTTVILIVNLILRFKTTENIEPVGKSLGRLFGRNE